MSCPSVTLSYCINTNRAIAWFLLTQYRSVTDRRTDVSAIVITALAYCYSTALVKTSKKRVTFVFTFTNVSLFIFHKNAFINVFVIIFS